MVLTSFPSEPADGALKVRILADTICHPHGAVSKGEIAVVSRAEYYQLRAAHKAALARVDDLEATPAEALPAASESEAAAEPRRKAKK